MASHPTPQADSFDHVTQRGLARRISQLRQRMACSYWKMRPRFLVACKRSLDVGASAAGLVVLAPLFGLVAVLIKLTDRGPVFFYQDRVGKFGKTFRFPKFRSMIVDAEQARRLLEAQNQHAEGVTFKMKRDPRITWIGRLIRRASIDELPQLWCVLKGEMSLVGPRPPLPREVAQYSLSDRRRLEAIPGLTCHWQVQGRANIPFPRQVELDVDYIEHQSIALDLKLLAQTVPAVLSGRGAY